jgi:hypothetical protein
MINFICTTAVCVQQYLGTGYIPVSDGQRFIWDGFNQDYVCAATSNIYTCSRINLPQLYIQR